MRAVGLLLLAFLLCTAWPQDSRAQQGRDLTVGGYGLAIGDVPRVNGLRLTSAIEIWSRSTVSTSRSGAPSGHPSER